MEEQLALVPVPAQVERRSAQFALPSALDVVAVAGGRPAAEYLGALLEAEMGLSVRFVFPDAPEVGTPGAEASPPRILFASPSGEGSSETPLGDEAYRLTIDDREIRIESTDPRGFFWATQTLRQLLAQYHQAEGGTTVLPGLEIVDRPVAAWRGLHFDVSRHFFSVGFIKKLIDLLAFYKLNVFHWHLTDDQGWRIEIKRYPELTEAGAWRRDPDGSRYGGFYTQEEIREVVAYASERQITVVPEIEMPGHARAAIAAFPWLSCTKEPLEVWNHGGISKELFCAGREEVFEFLQNVLDEVCDLFPSELIHIGGDECPKDHWKACPDCQGRIRTEGLENEEALQGYFVKRIQRYLSRLGRKMVGWDEILEGGLAPGGTVMSWRGVDGGIAAAKAGFTAVMSPTSHCYFDYRQSSNWGERGPTHFSPPVTTLRKVYTYHHIPAELGEGARRQVIGAQANVWTEDIATDEHAGYMIFPRLCALAETLWSPAELRDWSSFKERLTHNIRYLDRVSMAYCTIIESIES